MGLSSFLLFLFFLAVFSELLSVGTGRASRMPSLPSRSLSLSTVCVWRSLLHFSFFLLVMALSSFLVFEVLPLACADTLSSCVIALVTAVHRYSSSLAYRPVFVFSFVTLSTVCVWRFSPAFDGCDFGTGAH